VQLRGWAAKLCLCEFGRLLRGCQYIPFIYSSRMNGTGGICLMLRIVWLQFVLVVKKTTGGRAWLPKWGFAGLTRLQKANKRKQRQEETAVLRALREAAAREPTVVDTPHTSKQ